jgi:hypothetical protein
VILKKKGLLPRNFTKIIVDPTDECKFFRTVEELPTMTSKGVTNLLT